MKKLIVALSVMLALNLSNSFISAQNNVYVNVNIDKQPAWGPTGYDYVQYYYFPNLNIYYDVNNSLFYFLSGSKWASNQYLPSKYDKYDLYTLYKVVCNESTPWQQNRSHKREYSSYKKNKTQNVIRNSNETKYASSKKNERSWTQNSNSGKESNKSGNSKKGSSNNKKQENKNNSSKR